MQELAGLKVDIFYHTGKKIVHLGFEGFSQFRFQNIRLKHKIDADRRIEIQQLQVMETRGLVFSN